MVKCRRVLALVVVVCICQVAAARRVEPDELQLNVEPLCPRGPLSQEVLIKVTLRNLSKRALEVPSIFLLSDAIELVATDVGTGKRLGRFSAGVWMERYGFDGRTTVPAVKLARGGRALSYFALPLRGAQAGRTIRVKASYRLDKDTVIDAAADISLRPVNKDTVHEVRAALAKAGTDQNELAMMGETLCGGGLLLSAEESVQAKVVLLRTLARQDADSRRRVVAYYYVLKDENFRKSRTLAALLRSERQEEIADFVAYQELPLRYVRHARILDKLRAVPGRGAGSSQEGSPRNPAIPGDSGDSGEEEPSGNRALKHKKE